MPRMINALEEREERLAVQNSLARQNRELELTRQHIERQNLQLIEAAAEIPVPRHHVP